MILSRSSLFGIRFDNISKANINRISTYFGNQCLSKERLELELKVNFKSIPDLDEFRKVGRDLRFNKDVVYIPSDKGWCCLPLSMLLNLDFSGEIGVTHNVNIVNLIGSVLDPLLKIYCIQSGLVPVHSSSIIIRDRVILFPAWGNVGKTNLLLAAKKLGGIALSDDWTTIDRLGRVFPDIRPLNLLYYNFSTFPELKGHVNYKTRFLIDFQNIFSKLSSSILHIKIIKYLNILLETLSNVKLPMSIPDEYKKGLRLDDAFLLYKHSKKSIEFSDESLNREFLSKAMWSCFLYENDSIFNMLKQASYYKGYSYSELLNMLEVNYVLHLTEALSKTAGVRTACLPEKPTEEMLLAYLRDVAK